MRKELLFCLLLLALPGVLIFAGGSQESRESLKGTYSGTAQGYHGELTAELELNDEGEILSFQVPDTHHETEGVGTLAIEKVSAAVLAGQSLHVDSVSGATMTTNALLKAASIALRKSGADPSEYGYTEVKKDEMPVVEFKASSMPEKMPVEDSITVKDARGRRVEIDLPVSSYAISTMDVIDFIIPLLGKDAFHKLVASGQDGGGGIQRYARMYMPIVGPYLEHMGQISEHNAPFDLEMILAMNPDVLIVNSAMGAHRYALEVQKQLDAAGIPVVLIDVPGKSISTSVQDTMTLLGRIFQKSDRAAEVNDFLDNQSALLKEHIAAVQGEMPAVYYEKSGYSEVFGSTQSSVSTGWGAFVAAAGGRNIADRAFLGTKAEKSGRGTLDPELILQADPDFIILSASGAGWMDNFPDDPADVPQFDIVNRVGWKNLKAVKNGNVYEIAHAMNRSVYSFYAHLKLASIFHPEEFGDVDAGRGSG